MFDYDVVPSFIGWAGLICKFIPLIFASIWVTFIVAINFLQPNDVLWTFMSIKAALKQEKINFSEMTYEELEKFQEFEMYLTNITAIVVVALLLLFGIDIMLIRGANSRSHTKLIPGIILYALKIILCITIAVKDYNGISSYGAISAIIYGFVLAFLVISFRKFHGEAATRQYKRNIRYVNVDQPTEIEIEKPQKL